MERGGIKVIEISPSSTEKDRELDGSPRERFFRVKNKTDMEKLEETEDCFILDFDPFQSLDLSKLSISTDKTPDSPELSVIAEKGKVACRDYPHSRHLCVKYSFDTTPHERYCEMCYCYVCDSSAPCEWWTTPGTGHCHATEHDENWKLKRMKSKQPAVGLKWELSDSDC